VNASVSFAKNIIKGLVREESEFLAMSPEAKWFHGYSRSMVTDARDFFHRLLSKPLGRTLKEVNDIGLGAENLAISLANSAAPEDIEKAEKEIYGARRALIKILAGLEDSRYLDQPGLYKLEAVANTLGGYSEEDRNCPVALTGDDDTLLGEMSEMAEDDKNAKKSLMLAEYDMLLGALDPVKHAMERQSEEETREDIYSWDRWAFYTKALDSIARIRNIPAPKGKRRRLSVREGRESVINGSSWKSSSWKNSIHFYHNELYRLESLNPSDLAKLRHIEEGALEEMEERRAGNPGKLSAISKKAKKYWAGVARMFVPEKMGSFGVRNLWKIARIRGEMTDVQESMEETAELLGKLDIENSCEPGDASGDQHCINMAALLRDALLEQNVSKNMANGLYGKLHSPSHGEKEPEDDSCREEGGDNE
jgi:hypothetical protein